MRYKTVECYPSSDDLQGKLDYWANRGWTLKATLTGISPNNGWLTLVFEQPI